MSVFFLIAAMYMANNNVANVEMDFFIAWALFAIADAIWIGRCKK